MKISVFGTGYVGLVTSICFSEMGNYVHCVDVDLKKIALLKSGQSPIYEPGLESLLQSNLKAGRIHFTADAKESIKAADLLFIAVGTPSLEDGSADLKYVLQVAETIAENMQSAKTIVVKSTVPVGTFALLKKCIEKKLKSRGVALDFYIASNPEFLREGCAIDDCLKPNRVVVGVDSIVAREQLQKLYEPFLKNGNPFLVMDQASAEMTKYAANAMLATKISLMNELSRVCSKLGADIEAVRKGIGSDSRIGPHFIYAGLGYGGSCFPKDVDALVHTGQEIGEELLILSAVEKTNVLQRERFIEMIEKNLPPSTQKCMSIWGVSFKPGTDDIRAAPALYVIQHFLDKGYKIQIYDPIASENARTHFNNNPALSFFDDQYLSLEGSDALVVATEWKSFREPDFDKMKSVMKNPLIFDGRNIYTPDYIKQKGFNYFSIGRPS